MKKKLMIIVFLLLLCLPAIRLVFGPGFYSLHDDLHVGWLDQMDRAFRDGQLPPRWAPDLSFAYGYPLFNFVYPLPFYLGEVFHLLGLGLVASVKAVFIFSILASAVTMFLFLRSHFSSLFSFLGALFYVYTPYRAVEIFVRGAIGEALVFVFLPLTILFLEKACRQSKVKDQIGFGISLAGLILSHNISAFMVLPFLILYGLIVVWQNRKRKVAFFSLLKSFVLAGLLSAYFWLPAMIEKKYMVVDTVFNFKNHFPFIKQLVFPSWGYGISIWGPRDEMSFQIGVVNLLAFLISLVVFFTFLVKKRKSDKKGIFLLAWVLLLFSASCFLMNIRSSFIWENFFLLPYFQFPWRFLMITTFSTPILFAFLEELPVRSQLVKRILGISLAGLALVLVLPYFSPEKIFPERNDDYFLRRYLPNRTKDGYTREVSQEYLENTEEYLRLPLWTERRPKALPVSKLETDKGKLSFKEKKPTFWEGEIESSQPAVLVFHQYYFPGWKAWLDEQEVEIFKNSPHGDMKIEIPTGVHEFKFQFRETNLRLIADLISLISWGVLSGLILFTKGVGRKSPLR